MKRRNRRSKPPFSFSPSPWQSKQCALRMGRMSFSKTGEAAWAGGKLNRRKAREQRKRRSRKPPLLCGLLSNIGTVVGQDFFYDAAWFAVGDSFFLAVVVVKEFGVIEAEEVEQGGVIIVRTHGVNDGFVPEFVGFAVGHAAFDSTAGEPGAKALAIMV